MKIQFIISSLSSGGAERVLSNLANHLSKKHEITIVTFSCEEPFYFLSENIQLIKLDLLKKSKNIFDSVKNTIDRIFTLRKIMKGLEPDVNISFMTHTNILSIIAAKLTTQKIIVSERTIYDFDDSRILNFFRRVTYPFCDYLIAQTQADKQHYHFMNNVQVIYNPISLDCIEKKKKQKIILAVGRLDKQKGFDNLIYAFSKLQNNDWTLCIAGDGEEKNNLEHLAKTLNVLNIEFLGNRKDIYDWYAKSSIFVLSSKKEGFPNVLLEAMANSCAVVSFDCPSGPAEIIEDGKNGILVENQNIEKLTEAMQRLINDDNLRETFSKEASKAIEKYSIIIIGDYWENIIQKVADK